MTQLHDGVPAPVGVSATAPGPATAPAPEAAHPPAPIAARATADANWVRHYRLALVGADSLAVALALITGYLLRFGTLPSQGRVELTVSPPTFAAMSAGLLLGWLIALQACGGYEVHRLATGPTEAKIVIRASVITVGVLATYSYATRAEIARGFVIGIIPVAVALLLIGRAVVRGFVNARRRRGRWVHRILAVGTADTVHHLREATERATHAGLRIIGACVDDAPVGSLLDGAVEVVGRTRDAAATAEAVGADVVAVTGGLRAGRVRELGWQLESTDRGLVMAPALTQIAGPRVHVSPVAGLPLVWLERPHLERVPRTVKRAMDVVLGAALLVVALPVLLVAAVAIRLGSRGPLLYRQPRLGQGGEVFPMLKLRTMTTGAHGQRDSMLDLNEQDGGGVLFKMRWDPRVTRVGRVLRAFSIDELPQLVHVVTGRMSLVGPRPLAAEDSTYTGDARRRLLMRPGLTGLWQVSGRSELSWEDAVRLDLYYVENWSLGMDLGILARTVLAVLRRKGAY